MSDRAEPRRFATEMTLTLSPEARDTLNQILDATTDTPADLLRKAAALYASALAAHRAGKAVGIAPGPDALETEFVGFGGGPPMTVADEDFRPPDNLDEARSRYHREVLEAWERDKDGRNVLETPLRAPVGLTDAEKRCLRHLGEAWSVWVKLPTPNHPSDLHEFQSAIHYLQSLVAFRVARRVDPDEWWQPD